MRSNGGLSGAKKTVSTSAASGIWSIRDAQRERADFTWPGSPTPFTGNYLVLAGGGGGAGNQIGGGGGGAGGMRSTVTATGGSGSLESPLSLYTNVPYIVTVGAGGTAGVRYVVN